MDATLVSSWPTDVYSLTHIALPFTQDDMLYGTERRPTAAGLVRLGRLSPRGERSVLTVSTETLMRLSSNPFFPYLADTLRTWVGIQVSRAKNKCRKARALNVAQERIGRAEERPRREAEVSTSSSSESPPPAARGR